MKESTYFRYPGVIPLLLVPVGLTHLTLSYVNPSALPLAYMGPLGTFTRYVITQQPSLLMLVFYLTWLLHAFEAYTAFTMARKKRLDVTTATKWCLQTSLYGFFSIRLLRSYRP